MLRGGLVLGFSQQWVLDLVKRGGVLNLILVRGEKTYAARRHSLEAAKTRMSQEGKGHLTRVFQTSY